MEGQQISGDVVPRGYDVRIWLFRREGSLATRTELTICEKYIQE